LFIVLKYGWLEPHHEDTTDAKAVMSAMNPDYAATIRYVPKLLGVDFSSLLLPHTDYAEQTEIQKDRVWLLMACAVYYDPNFGGVEYLAEWHDVDMILENVAPHVSEKDLAHIERILRIGCPADFTFDETDENKETFIR